MEKIISFILAILLAGLNAYGVWKKAVLVCVDSALPENKDYTYLLKHYGVKKAVKTITDTSRIEDLYELLAHSKKIELKKPDNGCFCVYIKGDSSSINIIGGTKDMLIGSSLYETNRELLSKIYELSEFNYSRYLNLDDINIEDIDFVDIKSVMPNIFTTRDVLFYEFDDFFKGELKNSRIFCKPHILCVINALTTKRESENNNDMPIIDTRFVMDIHLKGGKDVIKIYGNESLFVVNNNVYKTDSIVSNLIWNTDYLRDNLGSVRVEVDGEGEVVRGADYSSTGVPMERRWRSPSGLELYGGKQYYGIRDLGWYDNSARTLESVMQRFTSMDPLCEKYPAVSPYAYCAGNPLRYIDPDGKDVYELTQNGRIKKRYENADYDQFVIVQGNKKIYSQQYEYGNGEFYDSDWKSNYKPEGENSYAEYDKYIISNESAADGIFDFLTDNIPSEFSKTSYNDNNNNKAVIATGGLEDAEPGLTMVLDKMFEDNTVINSITHNHPSLQKGASSEDIKFKQLFLQKYLQDNLPDFYLLHSQKGVPKTLLEY